MSHNLQDRITRTVLWDYIAGPHYKDSALRLHYKTALQDRITGSHHIIASKLFKLGINVSYASGHNIHSI